MIGRIARPIKMQAKIATENSRRFALGVSLIDAAMA